MSFLSCWPIVLAITWFFAFGTFVHQTSGQELTGMKNILIKKLNAVRYADQFGGADAGTKINACIADLPSTGGICDARGLEGAQTISAPITFGDRHVTLLLGTADFTGSGDLFSITTATNKTIRIIGSGVTASRLTSTNAAGRGIVAIGTNTVEIRDLTLTASVTKTSGAAIDVSGSGTLKAEWVQIEEHYNGILIGGSRSNVEIEHLTLSNLENDGVILDSTGAEFFVRDLISNNSPRAAGAGLRWLNGNGVNLATVDLINFNYGVIINPSTGKTTQFGFFRGAQADNYVGAGFWFTGAAGTGGQIVFVDCWAVTGQYGVRIDTAGSVVKEITWIGGKIQANTIAGVLINNSGSKFWIGGGTQIRNNGVNGIVVGAGASDWTVNGVVSGGGTQKHGIFINAGASNNYSIINNDFSGNTLAAISDGGAGTNKQIYGNRPDSTNRFLGNLTFESGRGASTGTLDHANTAIRTWTLPDRTGKVAVPLSASVTYDPPKIATDGVVISTTVIVTGAAAGDPALASHDQIGANNVLLSAHVQSADTVRVIFMNKTGGAIDIPSGTLKIYVFKD